MQTEWMEIAEFAAYVMAVVVGLDMIAERWLPCCKNKAKASSQNARLLPEHQQDVDETIFSASTSSFEVYEEN